MRTEHRSLSKYSSTPRLPCVQQFDNHRTAFLVMLIDIDIEPIQHKRRRIPRVLRSVAPAAAGGADKPPARARRSLSSGMHLTQRIQPWDANVTI